MKTSSVKSNRLDAVREAGAALARQHPLTTTQAEAVRQAVRGVPSG